MFNFLKQANILPEKNENKEKSYWEFFAKTYSAPNPSITTNLPESVLEKAVLGVTTFLWVNEDGEIKTQAVLGSDENPLFDVLDKAMTGIQYVTYKGRKFGVALVPQEQATNLPLR